MKLLNSLTVSSLSRCPITTVLLAVLCTLALFGLSLGNSGWLKLRAAHAENAQLISKIQTATARNERLQADVADLKNGLDAVEETARYKFGYIKPGEKRVLYVQQ